MSSAPPVRSHPLGEGLEGSPAPSPQKPKSPGPAAAPVAVDTSVPEIQEVINPHTLPPSHRAAPGATSAPGLEATSVVDIVGDQGLQRASVLRVTPGADGSKLSHISAPADSPVQQQAARSGLRKAWDRLMEVTPGTRQHKAMYGARWTLGSYRLGPKR